MADRLTSSRGAWISLGVALLALVALFGAFGRAEAPALNAQSPADSESAQVSQLLQEFPDADKASVLVVVTREDSGTLTEVDRAALEGLLPVLEQQASAAPPVRW